jgi:hypothetical protein
MQMKEDTSIAVEDLLEPTEDDDDGAVRTATDVAEAIEAWEPPV